MRNSCKVAFIGAGYMASEHIKSFTDIQNVHIVGVYSRTKLRAENLTLGLGLICGVYNSIYELYEKLKPDLVVISVPELEMREVCFEAFKYDWACLIEKPAGFNLNDAEMILNKATTLNRNVFVGLNRRHYSSTKKLLQKIAGQEDKRMICICDQEDQLAARKMGQPEIVVKNWMYANSIHLIDLFSVLGRGKITSVEPVVRWDPENPQFVVSKIIYDSGDVGMYEAVWNCPGPWSVSVSNSINRYEMRPLETLTVQSVGSRVLEKQTVHKWDVLFKPGLRLQAEEAVKAASGLSHNLPTLLEAMHSMQLIHAIYEGDF